ncbi:MAG: response regulator [Planctomycetota bacterium]
MFEPFFTTKTESKGTGLGLPTAYGIVKQSGGDIAAVSEPGYGATFNVWLPAAAGTKKAMKEPATAPTLDKGTGTVLLVEDDETVRTLEGRTLREQGYTVLEAGSGPDALRVSEEHAGPTHLLVTDVVMPGMNGKDIAGALLDERERTSR